MRWDGWGDPERAIRLPAPVVALLGQVLGISPPPAAAESGPSGRSGASGRSETSGRPDIDPPSRGLAAPVYEAFAGALGRDHVRVDAESRIRHTRGKSTPDLLRIRAGDAAAAPDAVLYPCSHEEVLAALRVCAEHRIAAIPFGGGTSVTGGLAPRAGSYAGVVALDLRRLDRLLAVDPESRTATLQAGLRAPRAEALLAEHGLTLGHFPQSYEWASLGGFAATRSSGQASAGYGRFDDMVQRLTVATPRGTWELGRAPRSAAGPDLRQLVLGSEGAFGVITSLTAQVRPAPETSAYEGWRFPAFAAGTAAVRELAQAGAAPTVLRLSDEVETMVGLAGAADGARGTAAMPGTGALAGEGDVPGTGTGQGPGCLLVAGYEGTADDVAAGRLRAGDLLRRAGGRPLGAEPGEAWARGRYSAPYLRDALLDVGVFAETLETATFWSGLPRLYRAVREALTTALTGDGRSALVLCHISHVYPAGASLYFTAVCAGDGDARGDGVLARWARAKRAAGDAIVAAGGTISHHHGVGTDHHDWLEAETGALGIEVLRAVKERLDPTGILNPGVLLPDGIHPPAPGPVPTSDFSPAGSGTPNSRGPDSDSWSQDLDIHHDPRHKGGRE